MDTFPVVPAVSIPRNGGRCPRSKDAVRHSDRIAGRNVSAKGAPPSRRDFTIVHAISGATRSMSRRRRDKKRTTVDRDLFGRKVIETEYVPAGGRLLSYLGGGMIFLALLFAASGC